jgi:hypothetical protein
MRTWFIHEKIVCSFSNITSHRHILLLSVKCLAMITLTRKYWVSQQYTECDTISEVPRVFSFEEKTRNGIKIMSPNSFLCCQTIKAICSFEHNGWRSTLRTQPLYCKSSLVSALLGVAFGGRYIQTLPYQICLCWNFSKKEFILPM